MCVSVCVCVADTYDGLPVDITGTSSDKTTELVTIKSLILASLL